VKRFLSGFNRMAQGMDQSDTHPLALDLVEPSIWLGKSHILNITT
jgi:hypothetical protein